MPYSINGLNKIITKNTQLQAFIVWIKQFLIPKPKAKDIAPYFLMKYLKVGIYL